MADFLGFFRIAGHSDRLDFAARVKAKEHAVVGGLSVVFDAET
jgi:hypothetical protein